MYSVRRDRVIGCIVGGAIGDAAASAFEGVETHCFNILEGVSRWEITDDTQLTLATCEAIIEGRLRPEKIAEHLVLWFRARKLRRVGASTLKALRELSEGQHWALAGRKGEYAAGNGAAMRIAPLAFFVEADSQKGRELIRDVSRITHQNDEAYVGAVATAFAVQIAASGVLPSLEQVSLQLPDSVVRDRLDSIVEMGPTATIEEVARSFGATGYVADSIPLALFASQQAGKLGFSKMLEEIIAVGGDTDTNASIACQIVGASLGFSKLPATLLVSLPERQMIYEIACRFADRVEELTRQGR